MCYEYDCAIQKMAQLTLPSPTTIKEKDLRVTISTDMKVSEQCGIAASKGNQILGLIRRNITFKEKKANYTYV